MSRWLIQQVDARRLISLVSFRPPGILVRRTEQPKTRRRVVKETSKPAEAELPNETLAIETKPPASDPAPPVSSTEIKPAEDRKPAEKEKSATSVRSETNLTKPGPLPKTQASP